MTLTTDTVLFVGILVVAVCALLVVGLALWDVGRAWWSAAANARTARVSDRRRTLL